MTNKKRKREDQQQPIGETTAAASDTATEIPAKLTKQQKRDIKRSACSTTYSKLTLSTTAASTDTNEQNKQQHQLQCSADSGASDLVAPPTKLTKQQRRDAKRAEIKAPETTRASTVDDVGKQAIGKPSVYKRIPILPALSPFPDMKIDRFLNPKDKHFQKILDTCYDGFVLDKPEAYSDDFHTSFESAFLDMEKSGLFQFDLTQPAGLGTKVAKTFVTRCLVGEPGITYKYLGLRMFSHPWSDTENENENEMKNQGGKNIENCFVKVGKLNKILSERTAEHLQNSKKTEIGSCNYNLTLINRCFPINSSVVKMKLEPTFNNEKCTVSWHADSTLEHYSSIAVYHCTREKKTKMSEKIALANTKAIKMEKKRKSEEKKTANKIIEKNLEKIEEPGTVIPTITLEKNEIIRTCTLTSNKDKDVTTESKVKIERNIIKKDSDHVDDSWRISLRVCPNAEGPKAGKLKIGGKEEEIGGEITAPPLAIPLLNKWSYYLLDDFNHHHQHSVLAGKTDRFASTHRVCRTDGHTFQSIKHKCVTALQGTGVSAKQVRTEQLALNEVEFEWIRQFYVQGSKHFQMHKWWHAPILELMDLWCKLESRSRVHVQSLRDAADDIGNDKAFINTIQGLKLDNRSRKLLAKRRKRASTVTASSFEALIEGLQERQSKREGWHGRERDPAFESVPLDCQPMSIPFPFLASTIFKNGDGDDNTIDKGDDDRMEQTDQTGTTRLLEKKGESLPDLFITIEELRTYHEMYLRLVL